MKKVPPPEGVIPGAGTAGYTLGPPAYDPHSVGADVPSCASRGGAGRGGGRNSGQTAQVTAILKRPPAPAAGGGGPRSSALDVRAAGILGLAKAERAGPRAGLRAVKTWKKEVCGGGADFARVLEARP